MVEKTILLKGRMIESYSNRVDIRVVAENKEQALKEVADMNWDKIDVEYYKEDCGGWDLDTFDYNEEETLEHEEEEKRAESKEEQERLAKISDVMDKRVGEINNKELLPNFTDDEDKMKDFYILSKEEFLDSYSYLTDVEYDNTKLTIHNKLNK